MGAPIKDLSKLELGTQSGYVELTITDEQVDEYVGALGIKSPLFARRPGAHKRMAPPQMAPHLILMPLYIVYLNANAGVGVFAKQRFRILKPMYVGDEIKATGTLVDKYLRRGKNYVTFEGAFRGNDGEPLLVEYRTIMINYPEFELRGAKEAMNEAARNNHAH